MGKTNKYNYQDSFITSRPIVSDGELTGSNVFIQNPNFPCSNTDDADQFVKQWLNVNFPGVTENQLKMLGIEITFLDEFADYYIHGVKVSENEFYEYINNMDENDSVTTNGNEIKLISSAGLEHNDTITNTQLGNGLQSPGVIKISIPMYSSLKGIDEKGNITKETAANLNQITGLELFSAGISIYDTVDVLKNKVGFDKSTSLALIFISTFEEEIVTNLGLVGIMDANNNDVLNVIDEFAKKATVLGAITKLLEVGLKVFAIEEYAGMKVVSKLGAIPFISIFIDLIIDDRDEEFRITNDDDGIVIHSTQKNSEGDVVYGNYTIDINYEDPTNLYNQVITDIETSKLHMLNSLETLASIIRPDIISKVEANIIELAREYTTSKNVHALSDIMQIPFISFQYEYIYIIDDMFTSDIPYNDEKKFVYTIKRNMHMSVITYRLQREKVDKTDYVKEIDLMSDEYIDETDFDGMLIYQSNHMPPQSLNAINEKFVRSYYRKYANQYEGVRENPIQLSISKIADDKHNVYTGVLKLSDNFKLNYVPSEYEGLDRNDILDEISKRKTNFMSVARIALAKAMVEELYNDYLSRLLKNIEIAEKTNKSEQEIISAFDKALGKKW